MSPVTVGTIGIIILLVLMFCKMPIGIAMGLTGFAGFCYLCGWEGGLGILDTVPFRTAFSYTLCVIPLFILMGQFTLYADITEDLYQTMYKWLGRLPGGLAIATVAGCATFAAVSGSSTAVSATVASVALPHMKKYKYDPSLATGSVAAGGTLGILIPPSMGFIIYGIITQESIGQLFMSGILPGLLLTVLFVGAIYITVRRNPQSGPRGPRTSFMEKVRSLKSTWMILILFLIVMGGIYGGIFTPTEAGAIGAFGAFVISIVRRRITWQKFLGAFMDTGRITAMILILIIGATIFSTFLSVSTIPVYLANFVSGLNAPDVVILIVILLFYIILGCIMDVPSGLFLTLPIFCPVAFGLGYDPIWFGVIVVVLFEMGMITPPIGINVFVINAMAKDVSLQTIFRGIFPFFIAMIVCVVILIIFPEIATFLPRVMWS